MRPRMEPETGYISKDNKLTRRSVLLTSLGLIAGGVTALLASGGFALGERQKTGQTQKNTAKGGPKTMITVPPGKEIATIAGGCFWCVEAVLEDLKGVDKVVSGYSGGQVANPSYEAVCTGTTGHTEAVQITFDPKVISYADLLHIFFTTHDPTTLNRQGADSGTQYRSAIFYHNAEQKAIAEKVIKEITAEKLYPNPIVTEVTAISNWYPAEDYHQNYFAQNPNQGYCAIVIAPKVRKMRAKYQDKLKK